MSVQFVELRMNPRSGLSDLLRRLLHWQAYHHVAAEWTLILLFVTGLLLWDRIPVEWGLFRWSLVLHVIGGLLIFPLTTGFFWVAHRKLVSCSCKSFLRITGRIIDVLLLLCFISGLALAFWGATGNTLSLWMSDLHWISGLLLGPLVLRHAWRYSVLRLSRYLPQSQDAAGSN